MLWSLIKVVVFLAIIAGLALGAEYLMDSAGGVQITMAGTEFTLQPLQAVIALLVLLFAMWILLKVVSFLFAFLSFLAGDETAITRFFDRGRERRGYKALTEAMIAMAGGEGREAMRRASRAEKLLQRPELTGLLSAQAAELAGDRSRATAAYKALITHDETRFVGVRGILRQKLAEGDKETALKLAQKAQSLRPRNAEVQDTLLRLQATSGDWTGARGTLAAKLKSGTIPKDVYTRRTAVLALSQAEAAMMNGETTPAARDQAIEANRLSPDFVPAAVAAARAMNAQGRPKPAAKVIRKAWDTTPHPDLAAAFAELEPSETPAARLKRFQPLLKVKPDNPETRLVDAELHVAAEDFPGARRALGPLAEEAPDARFYTLMAAIERGEGASDTIVKGWLARALQAPRGPQWVCENCHTAHAEWAPVCSSCESFDTLSWTTPKAPVTGTGAATHLIPLIVGGPAATAEDMPVPFDPAPETASTPTMADVDVSVADPVEPAAEDDTVPTAEDVPPGEEPRRSASS
ncbi:heme biosynthesis protein HemY [Chachezhania sediminis]|uniref:heme biosynthesis protein HemY n=1 Tax=Chachezhania sediminis TaxID=2599291 RepID=UPI00131DD5EB|nr:heme biosynthesis HemY N-terminal domain-containing protein [Chachezhania sediminis]